MNSPRHIASGVALLGRAPCAQVTTVWNGGMGHRNWNNAANWPSGVSGPTGIAQFSANAIKTPAACAGLA